MHPPSVHQQPPHFPFIVSFTFPRRSSTIFAPKTIIPSTIAFVLNILFFTLCYIFFYFSSSCSPSSFHRRDLEYCVASSIFFGRGPQSSPRRPHPTRTVQNSPSSAFSFRHIFFLHFSLLVMLQPIHPSYTRLCITIIIHHFILIDIHHRHKSLKGFFIFHFLSLCAHIQYNKSSSRIAFFLMAPLPRKPDNR